MIPALCRNGNELQAPSPNARLQQLPSSMKTRLFRTWISAVSLTGFASAQDFASQVVAASGLGTNTFYNNPLAILGQPTSWNRDTVNGGTAQQVASSVVYGAWQSDPGGANTVCTIPSGGSVTVSFDTPILDDPQNWFGKDFIVFGNSFFTNSAGVITANSNFDNILISTGNLFVEPVTVSVSPDGIAWYTYASPTSDGYWPTQAFAWDPVNHQFAGSQVWTKPVNPNLQPSDVVGKTVAQVIGLYQQSAGGTAYDLAPSGFTSIRFIRLTSNGGEVDGISRVGHFKERGGQRKMVTRGRIR